MNRTELQSLSRLRVRDARALLRAGQFQAAYYLAGYAVECGLKACIARRIQRYDFPDKKTVDQSYSHDLNQLVRVAGLGPAHAREIGENPAFDINWAIVKDWSELARYDLTITRNKAEDMYSAVNAPSSGVLRWVRTHW